MADDLSDDQKELFDFLLCDKNMSDEQLIQLANETENERGLTLERTTAVIYMPIRNKCLFI